VNTADFEQWLIDQSYRDSTCTTTLQGVRQAYAGYLADPDLPPPPSTHAACKRLVAYCAATNTDPDLQVWLQSHGINPPGRQVRAVPRARKFQAESFSERDYQTILAVCSEDPSPEATVVYVLATTGLRIGDVLRIPTDNLALSLEAAQGGGRGVLPLERKGGSWISVPILGALDAWERLYDQGQHYRNIAGYVTDGGSESAQPAGMAYQRVHKWFRRLGAAHDLQGRVHLHRLRRTVAVRGLKATNGDLVAVGQMLGHTSITSTQKYVDEVNVDRVADLQRKIRNL